jgi:hypothetical protein
MIGFAPESTRGPSANSPLGCSAKRTHFTQLDRLCARAGARSRPPAPLSIFRGRRNRTPPNHSGQSACRRLERVVAARPSAKRFKGGLEVMKITLRSHGEHRRAFTIVGTRAAVRGLCRSTCEHETFDSRHSMSIAAAMYVQTSRMLVRCRRRSQRSISCCAPVCSNMSRTCTPRPRRCAG